jgi:uncharacterized damage-inducible protein DinB
MEIKDYIARQVGVNRRYIDGTLENLTEELVNWTPPGQANSIGATLLHMLGGEDSVINRVIQGQPMVWETGGWASKVGIPMFPMHTDTWKPVMAAKLSIAPIMAYKDAVRAATDAFLAAATPEALDRTVNFVGADRATGEVLAMVITHGSHHAGEIAALKGVQDCQGLPF